MLLSVVPREGDLQPFSQWRPVRLSYSGSRRWIGVETPFADPNVFRGFRRLLAEGQAPPCLTFFNWAAMSSYRPNFALGASAIFTLPAERRHRCQSRDCPARDKLAIVMPALPPANLI
jgi:hypothetical protein